MAGMKKVWMIVLFLIFLIPLIVIVPAAIGVLPANYVNVSDGLGGWVSIPYTAGGGGGTTVYLTCASELGAQVNSAATTLAAVGGGQIKLPNCITATWTTATSQLPPNISFSGYGQFATIITCSATPDCIDIHETWNRWSNTSMSTGSVIADFTMIGSAVTASSQNLIHGEGLNGYTIHDVALNGLDSSHEPTCMLFHNTTADNTFTERDVTYNFQFGQQCAISVHFLQDAGGNGLSLAYNQFEFSVAPTGPNYAIVFDGGLNLYGGTIKILGNYVGNGGGIVQFNTGSQTGLPPSGGPLEQLFISVENNGGTGNIVNATGTGSLKFTGDIFNGAPSSSLGFTNICAGSNCTQFSVNSYVPMGQLNVGSSSYNQVGNIASFVGNWTFGTNFALKNTTSGGQEWDEISAGSGSSATAGAWALSNTTSWPFMVFDNNSGHPLIHTLSNGEFGWNTTTTGGIGTIAQNAGLSSPSSANVCVDSTTPGNCAGTLKLGTLNAVTAIQANGTPGVSKTCTVLPTVVNGIITSC